jgi:hypothetical protein
MTIYLLLQAQDIQSEQQNDPGSMIATLMVSHLGSALPIVRFGLRSSRTLSSTKSAEPLW